MGMKPESVLSTVKSTKAKQNEVPLVLQLLVAEGLEGKGVVGEKTVDMIIQQAVDAHWECTDNEAGKGVQKEIREALYKALRIIYDFDTDPRRTAAA